MALEKVLLDAPQKLSMYLPAVEATLMRLLSEELGASPSAVMQAALRHLAVDTLPGFAVVEQDPYITLEA